MSTGQEAREQAHLRVRNVGGIDETAVAFDPGVTVLEGRNATNRTSLLQAVMAACGSDDVSVKGDAETAEVELSLGEENYTRTLTRTGQGVRGDGTPYLEDPELADLFAFLLEGNEARRAVARGEDLRDLIMRPVDTDEIRAEIERLVARRRELEGELEELEALAAELSELEAERADCRGELTELSAPPAGDGEDLSSELARRREEKQALETDINELQSVVGFNEELLEADDHEVFAAANDGDADGPVTDELLAPATVTCWTCGSVVDREQIRATLDRLRELSGRKFEELSELEDRIEELQAERRERQEARQRRERLEGRLEELDGELERQRDTVAELETRRDRLQAEVATVEEAVEQLEVDARNEILERHREANRLEHEIGRLESDLEDVEAEVAAIEERLDDREPLEAERAELRAELESLRTKIERIERDAVEAFNEHMDTVRQLLDYQNLERIWLERRECENRQTGAFELHVVRSTDSGATYEDTVAHLSESEREVTGLVFALAGYLVHDVHETVPFLLLDSLEAIDAERIAALVDYVAAYSPYLVVALLPEDAQALDEDYTRVTRI